MSVRRSKIWVHRLGAGVRLALAVVAGIACFLVLAQWTTFPIRLLSAWNSAAATYLTFAWLMFSGTSAAETRRSTQEYKQSGTAILAAVVTSCLASIGALTFLMQNLNETDLHARMLHTALSIVALILSWFLIHTRFALHYAHRYYEKHRTSPDEAGLQFPGKQPPDYLDFAYFSFVVGMTSQVSDVVVTTRSMRRLLLVHSVLAFGFNIAVLALSINIIASIL